MRKNTMIADLSEATVRETAVSILDNNVYLLTSKTTGAQILIDAADNPTTIDRLIATASSDAAFTPHLELVVTTHSHWDHSRALAHYAASGVRTVAGAEDVAEIERLRKIVIDQPVHHGDAIAVDGILLGVIGIRGHTPGSITLVLASADGPVHLFTGDSLFPGGVGKTDHDLGRFTRLITDVSDRIFDVFDDDTFIHPGHGPSTTVGAERPHLDEWRARGW
jgi:glyoxylase-like metal-dependent hydrolase (beta-lactamase superfamily II)